jgi:transcriptional regulator with XRE-family HTH domain
MTLGQAIQEKRLRRKLTLRQLSGLSGVSNPLISQIENGRNKNPGFWTVAKLAAALALSMKSLAATEEG